MEVGITDSARSAMVRAAVVRVERDELKTALALTADPRFEAPKAVANALNALRRHRDPAAVVGRPQYRAALPYVAAAVSDACLARTIEVLDEHSDDPTREQLLEALEEVGSEFTTPTVAVMLASVADSDMPASDLCFEIVSEDQRFGLADLPDDAEARAPKPAESARDAVTPEQREARRLKKQKDADERRKKMEAARKAGEQVRRERKKERTGGAMASASNQGKAPTGSVAPRVNRRAALTPLQEAEFDRQDPLVGSVVFAWVPFEPAVQGSEGVEGKSRRCVVVAGSPTHLLVRPGYSEGGTKSRDWKSVPLEQWKRAGFDRPTWIDAEAVRVDRDPEQTPVGRLVPEDWNSLW